MRLAASSGPRLSLAILLLVWIVGALYAARYLDRGWVPHDEGALALGAQRVLDGELPHRDFDEIYTGGLSYLNALTFQVLGTRLTSIRRALFLVFLIWIPAVYYIATRFAGPVTSGLVTLLAVTMSLPNYSAAVPSWYNLFLATLGAAALLRFLETKRRAWLFAAGVCAGLSCLAKVVGLYVVAAVGLVLLYWEQDNHDTADRPLASDRDRTRDNARPREVAYPAFVVLGMVAFVAVLVVVMRQIEGPGGTVNFVIPPAMLAMFLLWNELQRERRPSASRFRSLARLALPFGLGLCVVLGPFLLPYLISGALEDLARGLFVSPGRRVTYAAKALPPASTMLNALPAALLLALSSRWRTPTRYAIAGGLAVPFAFLLQRADRAAYYQTIFLSMRAVVPIVLVAGVVLLAWRARQRSPGVKDRMVFTVLAVTGMCSLVQFPFAAPIYFFYIAPLAVLALVAVLHYRHSGPRPVFVSLVLFYMIFVVLWVNRGFIYMMGVSFVPDNQTEILELDRGGLRVSARDKKRYEALVARLREHGGERFTYATPDCPEVYFLSGLRNPTRTMFDFFDDPRDRSARIEKVLEDHGVEAVVVNWRPSFSGLPPPELVVHLRREYPQASQIDAFEIRWKP